MKPTAHRPTPKPTISAVAALAGVIAFCALANLFLPPARASEFERARQHLPGGAGVAERYRAFQATANDRLLASGPGVTQFRGLPLAAAPRCEAGANSASEWNSRREATQEADTAPRFRTI